MLRYKKTEVDEKGDDHMNIIPLQPNKQKSGNYIGDTNWKPDEHFLLLILVNQKKEYKVKLKMILVIFMSWLILCIRLVGIFVKHIIASESVG